MERYPTPSKVVSEFSQAYQDLYEIRRILGSVQELPSGNLKTDLISRISLYLESGETVDSLKKEISLLQKQVSDSIKNCEELEDQLSLITYPEQTVPATRRNWTWPIAIFILGYVLGVYQNLT